MAKTVTLQQARTGRRSVTVDGTTFLLGEPVREVTDSTLKKLKELPDVKVHVAASSRSSTPDDQPDQEADQ